LLASFRIGKRRMGIVAGVDAWTMAGGPSRIKVATLLRAGGVADPARQDFAFRALRSLGERDNDSP
jgi:hypothetical protein